LLGVEQPKLQTHALSVELLSQQEVYSRSVASAINLIDLVHHIFRQLGHFFLSQSSKIAKRRALAYSTELNCCYSQLAVN